MKKPLGFMLGILTSALTVAGASYASTGVKNIHASFANIGVVVNGKNIPTTAQPFIYHANVYVPISTVGHALGATVQWTNKPATVNVTSGTSQVQPLTVYFNGQALTSGITDGKTFYNLLAGSSAYARVTGLTTSIDTTGNVNFQQQNLPVLGAGATPLLSLSPSALHGDFKSTALYPSGQLSGYWPASILGQLYPGQYTIEWAVGPGQKAIVPGIDYTLNGQYKTFTAQFAVDDLTKNFAGEVQLVVVGDGKTLATSGWVQGGAEPTPLSVDITGVNKLQLQYQLKDGSGNEVGMGQTYTAPAANPDGSASDPIVVTDLMNATLAN